MFKTELIKKIETSITNNYQSDNYWSIQYGNYFSDEGSFKRRIKEFIKSVFNPIFQLKSKKSTLKKLDTFLNIYEKDYDKLFLNIDDISKSIIIELIAYKILGCNKVKLSTNTPEIWQKLELIKSSTQVQDTINQANRVDIHLERFNLSKLGFDIDFYYWANGVMIDFVSEQFRLQRDNPSVIIEAKEGDVVIEFGACWGTTPLYFAEKVKESGHVYSFEFVPENLKIFNINIDLNPQKKQNITLVPSPVHSVSNKSIFFTDSGPSSMFSFNRFVGYEEHAQTITIDDYVEQNKLGKVDFISMDIEGSEKDAHSGTINTIKKFKPKLAISICHSDNDFVQIPNWILSLDLGYKIYINHYTIYAHETICFAMVNE